MIGEFGMKRRLVAILLCIVLAFSAMAVGCGPLKEEDFDILNLPY